MLQTNVKELTFLDRDKIKIIVKQNNVDYGGPYGWTDGNFFLGQKSFASVMISSDRARLGLLSQDVKK